MSEKFTSIEKAFKIIDRLVEVKKEQSLAELTRALSMPKTSLYRLCSILTRYDYLSKDESTGKYRIGIKFLEVSDAFKQGSTALQAFQDVLQELQGLTGETISVFRLSGLERKCVMRIESNNALRHTIEIGTRLPLHLGAGGVVLLANSTGELLDRYLKEVDLGDFYLHPDDLKNRLDRVRSKGYELSFGERSPYTAALAIPLYEETDQLFGVLSISGPVERFRQNINESQIEEIREFTDKLNRLIKLF